MEPKKKSNLPINISFVYIIPAVASEKDHEASRTMLKECKLAKDMLSTIGINCNSEN
jgi:hypothetical protein